MKPLTRLLSGIWLLLLVGCGASEPWNVVLFTFDTTRADFLGCYGKESARTPHLDRLAAEGFLFENAMASNPVTQAAHSTILTGVYPMAHGVRDNLLFRLPDSQHTLAELLRDRGYATGAAVGGFPLVASLGSAQGFDFYDDDLSAGRFDHRGRPILGAGRTWYDERSAGQVNDAMLPWLRERLTEDRPFFAWLHYWDPHEPHIPPAPYDELFAHDPYQGEIAYADRALGTILRVLEGAEELERTLIIMVADHGESRYDHHEATHAYLAYGSTLHVPLILRLPGRPSTAGRRIEQRVGTVDIVPTIMDLLGFDISDSRFQGRSLAPLMLDAAEPGGDRARAYYSESLSPRLSHGVGELRALYRGRYKYIHGPKPELYDLEQDPGELRDLAAELPQERARFERGLQAFLNDHAAPEAADAVHEVDEETRRGLEALGYLSTAGDAPPAVSERLSTEGAVPQDRVGDINLMSRLRGQLSVGQYQQAAQTARRLLESDPENPYYQGRLTAALVGLGELNEATAIVDRATRLSNANLDDFLGVAGALFAGGEGARALTMTERLLGAVETADGRLQLALMYRKAGELDAFERHLDRALELDDEHRGARLVRAELYIEQDDASAAGFVYRDVLADFPLDAVSLVGLAVALRLEGRAAEALGKVERARRLAPRFCEAHVEYVATLTALGRRDEVETATHELNATCPGFNAET